MKLFSQRRCAGVGFISLFIFLVSCSTGKQEFITGSFAIGIDGKGQIVQLTDTRTGADFLATGQPSPLLSIRVDGRIHHPSSMEYRKKDSEMVFSYDSAGVTTVIAVGEKGSHLRFEVIRAEPIEKVEMVIWGPYPTIIGKVIGETVGVVRDEEYALGLQSLNPKTLGGYPWKDNDCMPQLDIFEGGDYSDLSEEGKRYVLYRVEAAKPEDFGSTLQAYCRNRFDDRILENWGHEKYLAPAFSDGGVVGSAIALFGCPVEETLDHIEMIELAEGLPHPMIAGEWGKRSQAASSSYMIMGFGEADIEKALDYTRKAGLNYLYHPGPFETWGHFSLNKQFPDGWEGLKTCVEKAADQDIFLGVHTLSNFITPNDAYVTPVPDSRLAKVGHTTLVTFIDAGDREITIDDPSLFQPSKSIAMRTIQIGQELVQYREVSNSKPWKLLDCERGAFGTQAKAHESGTEVSLLADHAYKVFLSDAGLTMEMGETLARLFNETGIRQISFDGLEGNRSTGLGNYGEVLMTNTWYENLDEDIKTHYIADASRTSHFFWHIYSRMNWGEPWYAGFRESQAEYRFKNQAYFERNLMPGMLGWFLMTEETSREDIEWMLSKAAGYNAGFGFVAGYEALERNGSTNEILNLIRIWEQARMLRVFDGELRERLKNVEMEFHLQEISEQEWELSEIHTFIIEHANTEKQPGEPGFSQLAFSNTTDGQPMDFILSVTGGDVSSVKLVVDNNREMILPFALKEGEKLRSIDGLRVAHYDKNWKIIREINVEPVALKAGEHSVTLDCSFSGGGDSSLKLELRIPGEQVKVVSQPL